MPPGSRDTRTSAVCSAEFRLLQAPVGGLDPALGLQDAGLERADIAGEPLPGRSGDEIEARAGPARAHVDDDDEPPDAGLVVLTGQRIDLGIDDADDLLVDETAGIEGEIAEQEGGEQRKHDEIDQRQLECRRAE